MRQVWQGVQQAVISVSVKSDINRVLAELDGARAGSKKAISAALNRVADTVASRSARKATDVFNINLRDVRPFITARGAKATAGRLAAYIAFKIQAVPQELFKPRIRMQTFTIKGKHGTFKRKLPTVFFKRYRAGQYKYVKSFFPLHTRTTGRLSQGDKLKRRIGADRNKLTGVRFYIMPPRFVAEVLIPNGKEIIGERFEIEFRSAYRRFVQGSTGRTKRLNDN